MVADFRKSTLNCPPTSVLKSLKGGLALFFHLLFPAIDFYWASLVCQTACLALVLSDGAFGESWQCLNWVSSHMRSTSWGHAPLPRRISTRSICLRCWITISFVLRWGEGGSQLCRVGEEVGVSLWHAPSASVPYCHPQSHASEPMGFYLKAAFIFSCVQEVSVQIRFPLQRVFSFYCGTNSKTINGQVFFSDWKLL